MSTCVVDTSIERCENGEHIQGMGSVFPPAVAVKISVVNYLCFDTVIMSRLLQHSL